MEIIRINDKKLKITLDDGDMEQYGLSAETMDQGDAETRRVLWRILDEAKHSEGFDTADDRVLIQAYPGRRGGCELYVTRIAIPKLTGGRVRIYPFSDAESLFSACRHLSALQAKYESALYCEEEGGASYLLIREPSGEGLLPRLSSPLRLLEEFSRPLTGSTHLAYIKERARPVLSEGAIERIAALSDTEEARIHEALL